MGQGDDPDHVRFSDLARQDEPGGVGIVATHLGQELPAVLPGHPEVGDDHVDRSLGHHLQGGRGAVGEPELPGRPPGAQQATDTGEDAGLVVDE
jgi:hypothetical protein